MTEPEPETELVRRACIELEFNLYSNPEWIRIDRMVKLIKEREEDIKEREEDVMDNS